MILIWHKELFEIENIASLGKQMTSMTLMELPLENIRRKGKWQQRRSIALASVS